MVFGPLNKSTPLLPPRILKRQSTNEDRTGGNQGLFNVDFAVKGATGILKQGDIDRKLSEVWRATKAGKIVDTTAQTVGVKFGEFSGERFNLVKYGKKKANNKGKFEPVSGQNQFVIMDNILTPEECRAMHQIVTQKWKPIEPRYRASDVYVLNAPLLSRTIEARLEPYVPDTITDEFGQVWDLVGANNGFFRLISYVHDKVDKYPMHYDLPGNRLDNGVLPGCQDDETKGRRSQVAKTMLTFNLYLNGKDNFDGGQFTVFESPSAPLFSIEPQAGRAFLFRQGQTKGYLHDAGAIDLTNHPQGHKTIVRIDFVYKRRGGAVAAVEQLCKCKFCPERFASADAISLHEGIHDNPTSVGYSEWKQRLNDTFTASKKPKAEQTKIQERRAAVMGL